MIPDCQGLNHLSVVHCVGEHPLGARMSEASNTGFLRHKHEIAMDVLLEVAARTLLA